VSGGYFRREEISSSDRFAVFRAERASDRRPVVLKTVSGREDGRRSEALLHHELELLRRMEGLDVARPLGTDTVDGKPALVLEDAGPQNLAQLAQGRPLGLERFFELAISMAGILAGVHGQGVIHRDVCPANFVVGKHLTLVDFDLATAVPAFTHAPGVPGELQGTLLYIAPEQTGRTRRLVDYRADLYALGAIFYELLIGAPPFRLSDPLELVHAHVARPPHAPALLNPAVPTALSDIVLKLLSKVPDWRYQSAAALKADLEEAQRQWAARGQIEAFELGRHDIPYGLFLCGKLYGRDSDRQELEQALGRIARGPAEVLLLTGPAGVGKSSLVQEVREAAGGRFRWLSGKSDLLLGNVPYGPIIEAFRPLIRELSREPAEATEALRQRLRQALAPNGRVLTEMLPELEALIGEQLPAPDVGLLEAENRFQLAFGALVRALAESGPPIVLFLDDLQWTDPATLKLARAVAALPDLHAFLLLGSYRDTEVEPGHPLTRTVLGIREAGTRVNTRQLTPLESSAVLALLCDGLKLLPMEAGPLATIVHQKTGGNPFFVRRFLGFLHRSGVLTYSARQGRWTWDLCAAGAAPVSENVVDLLSRILRMLPTHTQEVLRTAACIGNRFSLGLLAKVRGEPVDDLARALWAPIQEGLLVPTQEDSRFSWASPSPVELGPAMAPTYRFCHDRIQQAAYHLLSEQERKELHLRIGQCLLSLAPREALEGALCPIVDQLDRAESLIPEHERPRVAELNDRAGRQARAATAYSSAVRYFLAGLRLLPTDAWRTNHHGLWFRLQRDAAECGAFAGDYALCEQLIDEGLERAEGLLEKAALLGVIIQAHTLRGEHHEALRRGRAAARQLGLDLPMELSAEALRAGKERARQALADTPDPVLLTAEPLKDPVERAQVELLANMAPSAWFSDIELFKLLSFRAVEMTARRGLTPASSGAYTYYGIALAMEQEYAEALRYARLGLRMAEQSHNRAQESRTLLVLGGHVSPWRAPLRESVPLFRRSYTCGVESGELQFAAYALANLAFALLFCGDDLDGLIAQVASTVTFYRRLGHSGGLPYVIPLGQAARCLKGLTHTRAQFDDESFDEASFLKGAAGNGLGLAIFYLVRLQTTYLLGAIRPARDYARKAAEWLPWMRSLFFQVDYYFYGSLVLVDTCAGASPEQQAELLRELRANLERLERWAREPAASFQHKRLLIAAELAALEQRPAEALLLYHQAIEQAGRVEFVQDVALAHERCARFSVGRGEHRVAALHLHAALEGYTRWGASAKVESLEEEFPNVTQTRRQAAVSSSAGRGPPALDYLTLFEAAETLSSELVLDRLLEKLTRICIEAASAEKAVLALDQGGLIVRATANALGEVKREHTSLASRPSLPVSLFEHVFSTGEVVVIGDASRDRRFASDPYLATQRVKSLFAVPLCHAGRRLGVLYFENNLSTDAFSLERVELFKMLSGEIAVALENSLLFEERQRAEAALRLLSDASAVLAESLDYEACLAKVGSLAVPALADWCLVDVLENGVFRPVAFAHVDPEKVPLVEALHREYPINFDSAQPQALVLRSGKPLLVPEVEGELVLPTVRDEKHLRLLQALEPRSIIAVPLAARGRVLGVALFVRTRPDARYGAADLALTEDLARRISLALDNAGLYRDLQEAMRLRAERDRYLRLTFRQLPGAMWTTDRELCLTYATGRLVNMPAVSSSLVVGKSLYEFLGTKDPTDALIAHHLSALAGKRQSFQYQFQGRWYAVLIEPLRSEQGELAGCVGAGFDLTEQRETQERLARNEARLAEAQRVAHIGSFEWDIAPNTVTWSDELHRIYGLEPGQFDGTFEAFLRQVHPDDLELTKTVIFNAFRQQKPFTYDHRVVRADGSARLLHTRADVICDEHGKPVRIVGTCWDVTELHEANQARERLLSLLQATIEATADGILVVDRDRKVAIHNQRFLSMWRIPSSIAGQRREQALLDFVVDQLEEPEEFTHAVHEHYTRPELESIDLVRFKDGRVFERYSRPQRVADTVVGRVWSFRDVSERERLLWRALFLSDAGRLLASLDVEKALDAVAHLAVPYLGDGCAIDLFSEGGPRRLIAVSRDEGAPISPNVHPTVLSGHSISYRQDSVAYLGVPLLVKGGMVGAITLCAPPHRKYTQHELELTEELARRAALAIENARLYQRAQDALKAREEFLSVAAHEIRGPVTSLHLAVQTLRKDALPEPVRRKMFEVIEREDRRLGQFVEELLDLGRIDAGLLQFQYTEVDLGEVVRDVSLRLGVELARAGSSLSITAGSHVTGSWDRNRMDQVMTNLLSNAIKFGLGKPIEISVHAHQGWATLSVTDHGLGIAREVQDRIFKPFERGVSARHYGGLGLGLHIVKTVVEGMGGRVKVHSVPRAGSTFTVELPQGTVH
jgi:PAS domain S-box-containing protein